MCHVETAYIMKNLIIMLYTVFVFLKNNSHVDFEILMRTFVCILIFFNISYLCSSHLSFKFSYSSRILIFLMSFLLTSFNFTDTFILNLIQILNRWISSYFYDTKNASCFVAQFKHILYVFFRSLQFCFVNKSYANRFMSFINLM